MIRLASANCVAASAVISYRQLHPRAVRSRQCEGFACRAASPQRRVPYRKRRDCRNPYFAGTKYHCDAHRQHPICLSIARSSELKLVLWRFPKSPKGICERRGEIRAALPPSGTFATRVTTQMAQAFHALRIRLGATEYLNGSECGSRESVACGGPPRRAYPPYRRCGRVAEGGGLLNRYRVVKPYRGFESLRLRHPSPAPETQVTERT